MIIANVFYYGVLKQNVKLFEDILYIPGALNTENKMNSHHYERFYSIHALAILGLDIMKLTHKVRTGSVRMMIN